MHDSCMRTIREFAEENAPWEGKTIGDFGSRDVNGNPRAIFESRGARYIGYDIEAGPNVDMTLPTQVDYQTLDAAICVNTLEHAAQPFGLVELIVRVVKSGGPILLVAPTEWPYHPHPKDYWRFWPDGIRELAESAGASVDTVRIQDAGDGLLEVVLIGRAP